MKQTKWIFVIAVGALLVPVACRDKGGADNRPAKVPNLGETGAEDSAFIGLEESDAASLAKKRGLAYRILSVDGKPRPMTMDLRHDRVNFEMQQGRVMKVTRG